MNRCFCGVPIVAWSGDFTLTVIHEEFRKEFDLVEFSSGALPVADWLAETVHGDAHNANSPEVGAGLVHPVTYRYPAYTTEMGS